MYDYLSIIESYTKYKIDSKTETESGKERKQHIQPGYNQTHTLENRSTISSHVNQTGRVNDSSLSTKMSCKRLYIFYHGTVREVDKKCMKLQISSVSKRTAAENVFINR